MGENLLTEIIIVVLKILMILEPINLIILAVLVLSFPRITSIIIAINLIYMFITGNSLW